MLVPRQFQNPTDPDWISTRVFANKAVRQTILTLHQELFNRLQSLSDTLSADVVTMFVYDEISDQFDLPIGYGLYDPASFSSPFLRPRTDHVAGKIVKEQRVITVATSSGIRDVSSPFIYRERILSTAGFPIIYEGTSLGVLFVSYRQQHVFTDLEEHTIGQVCEQIASIVLKTNAIEILRQNPYHEYSENERALVAIVRLVCSYLKMPTAIWLMDNSDKSLRIQAATGLTHTYISEAVAQVGDGSVISQVVESGEAQSIPNICQDARFYYSHHAKNAGWVSMLGYPIKLRGQYRGVLEVFTFEPYDFTQYERNTLRDLANLASITIENTYGLHELRKLSEVAHALRVMPNVGRAMQVIVESARELTGADSCTIFLLNKQIDSFVIGGRSPAHETPPLSLPRAHGGLTRYIIETGEAIYIEDTSQDTSLKPKLRQEIVRDGTCSLIGVRVQMENEGFGVLYVSGNHKSHFSQHDIKLLQTLADQISLTLGWSRLLLKPSNEVEKATANIFSLEAVLNEVCSDIQTALGFDFVAIQLTRPETDVIETVHGTGLASKWLGQAKHFLEADQELRDIQADIVKTGYTEIISGWDTRFDQWLYDEHGHGRFARIFTPIVLVRNQVAKPTEDWVENAQWNQILTETNEKGNRTVIEMTYPKPTYDSGSQTSIEIIGTVEAGFQNKQLWEFDTAVQLARLVAHYSLKIYSCLLPNVLETIVEQARQIVRADSASIQFYYDKYAQNYTYEVCAGRINPDILQRCRSLIVDIGNSALQENVPKFIPDPTLGHGDLQLKEFNIDAYEEGIRAIIALPLLVEQEKGVLNIYFDEPHKFTEDEIGWLQLFANRAVDAIMHATMHTQMRDQVQQLATLHSIVQSQVRSPEDRELLSHIAWSTLNILAADVVTIYEYFASEKRFRTPPDIAGRLFAKQEMFTGVKEHDASVLLLTRGINIFAEDSVHNDILNNPNREKSGDSFVNREKIVSSAGVLLVVGTEIVGVLFINYRRFHQFPAKERQFIVTLASSAAIAIKNRRMIEAFYDIDREIITTLDLNTLLNLIVTRAVDITRADLGEIRELRPVDKELVVQARFPAESTVDVRFKSIKIGEGITGWVAANRQSALVDDVLLDPRYKPYFPHMRSELAVPLLDRENRVLGVLNVESRSLDTFNRRDQRVLEALANLAVIAMQNAKRQKQLIAAETIATLGHLAGPLLHWLNNEIGAIKVHARDIQELPDSLEQSRSYARIIESITQNLTNEIRRLNSWMLEVPQTVDIRKVVEKAMARISIPAEVITKVEVSELPTVPGGETQLMHTLMILIQNAVDAMQNKGLLILRGTTEESDGTAWAALTVHDTGIGIIEDQFEAIFKRNFTGKDDGMGFGLWWARTYVESLGGTLEVQSKVGEGSCFTITLPAQM